jgi:hypothetical protein
VNCPHLGSQCIAIFNSVKKLKFHLQNIYCFNFTEKQKPLKRLREDGKVELEPVKGKRRRSYNKELSIDNEAPVKIEYSFINETMENIVQHPFNRSATPSSQSILDFSSCMSGSWTKNGNFLGTDTSLSSVCSGIFKKIDLRLLA